MARDGAECWGMAQMVEGRSTGMCWGGGPSMVWVGGSEAKTVS